MLAGGTSQIGTGFALHLVHKYGCFKLVQLTMTDTSTANSVAGSALPALPENAWLLRPAEPVSQPAEGPQPLAGLRFAVKDNSRIGGKDHIW